MKRLLTIFVSSVIGMGLWAQSTAVPMTIVGDVYNAGDVVSLGSVHFKAIGDDGKAGSTKVGRLDNYGNLDVKESIILYTNNDKDGLLKNNHKVENNLHKSHDAAAVGVSVRKTFPRDAIYYYVSLPFDLDLTNGVKDATDGKTLVQETDFRVQFYDAQKRAETGRDADKGEYSNWIDLNSASQARYIQATPGATSYTGLKKGSAFRIQVLHSKLTPNAAGEFEVDFVAKQADVASLLKNDDKGVSLSYFTPADSIIPNNIGGAYSDYWSDGWNIIGGLNTDLFELKSGNVELDRTVYYYDSNSAWNESLPTPSSKGVLRPYGVMFVRSVGLPTATLTFDRTKGPATPPINRSTPSGYGGYAYYYEGNSIDPASGSIFFRSIQGNLSSYDLFTLSVMDEQNNPNEKLIHFKFNDNFSRYHKAGDPDDVTLTNLPTERLNMWSVSPIVDKDKEYKSYLFVNALPYDNDQEVPVGINIPKAGNYTFSMIQDVDAGVNKIRNIFLYDKDTDKYIDLLQYNYSFTVNDGYYATDRFVLFINNDNITGIDKLPNITEIYAYAENNILTVKNLKSGDRVQIFDLAGRTIVNGVASGNIFTASLNQKGVYIVNVRGGKTLRVLNK